MAEGDGLIYNSFKGEVMKGTFNLANAGHNLRLTLHTSTYSPDIDNHSAWLDTGVSSTDHSTHGGYTQLGKLLGSQAVSTDTSNNRGKFDAADVTWTNLALTTPSATPGYCILWDDSVVAAPIDALIAYWELGGTATNGGDYTIQWGANGILLLT